MQEKLPAITHWPLLDTFLQTAFQVPNDDDGAHMSGSARHWHYSFLSRDGRRRVAVGTIQCSGRAVNCHREATVMSMTHGDMT